MNSYPILNEKIFTVRLCHLKKSNISAGYGFNILSKRQDLCQYIGKVDVTYLDVNTPAHAVGLRSEDKIIEINNINVQNYTHEQIIKAIKSGFKLNERVYLNEVLLLVVDKKTDEFYKKLKTSINSSNKNIPVLFKSSNYTPINVDYDQKQLVDSDEEVQEISIKLDTENETCKNSRNYVWNDDIEMITFI
jgi:hypothetical protein